MRRWPLGEPLALQPRMQAMTLEVILRVVFGIDRGPRLVRLRELIKRLLDVTTQAVVADPVAAPRPRAA